MILCFNQPFATGICRGLYPAIFTDQPLVSNPERAYIYSLDVFRRATDFPIEWLQESFNNRIFGNIPEENELPTNSLLGFVDILAADPRAQKLSTGESVYLVRNAHEFVAPFEIELDEIANYSDLINQFSMIPRPSVVVDFF